MAGSVGGRSLQGTIPAGAANSRAAFRTGLAMVKSYFDRAPVILSVVESNDSTLTLGLFKATLAGQAVGGFVLTTFVPHGASQVDVLFDATDRVSASMPAMLAQVSSSHPTGGPAASAAAVAPLHAVVSPDGTVHARIPEGWKTPVFGQGQLVAVGPDGAEVDQELEIPCVDPSAPIARNVPWLPVPYTRNVAQAYLAVAAALVSRHVVSVSNLHVESVKNLPSPIPGAAMAELIGTDVVAGVTHRFDGVVVVSPIGQYGGWNVTLKMIGAPAASIDRDAPTLLAIFGSYNVDQQKRGEQVALSMQEDRAGMARAQQMSADTQARDTAVFEASMGHARAVQQSIDRSTSGFVHYLNDTTVLEGPGGARSSENADFAQSVVNGDPNNFRIVPVSEYNSGD